MNLWYGIILTDGEINVKRYFDRGDIEEADESIFVQEVIEPFEAIDRLDALNHVKKLKQ